MNAKEKAEELVDKFRIMLMHTDTECGEEILCTSIAKQCALIAVNEIIKSNPKLPHTLDWQQVKQKIEKL